MRASKKQKTTLREIALIKRADNENDEEQQSSRLYDSGLHPYTETCNEYKSFCRKDGFCTIEVYLRNSVFLFSTRIPQTCWKLLSSIPYEETPNFRVIKLDVTVNEDEKIHEMSQSEALSTFDAMLWDFTTFVNERIESDWCAQPYSDRDLIINNYWKTHSDKNPPLELISRKFGSGLFGIINEIAGSKQEESALLDLEYFRALYELTRKVKMPLFEFGIRVLTKRIMTWRKQERYTKHLNVHVKEEQNKNKLVWKIHCLSQMYNDETLTSELFMVFEGKMGQCDCNLAHVFGLDEDADTKLREEGWTRYCDKAVSFFSTIHIRNKRHANLTMIINRSLSEWLPSISQIERSVRVYVFDTFKKLSIKFIQFGKNKIKWCCEKLVETAFTNRHYDRVFDKELFSFFTQTSECYDPYMQYTQMMYFLVLCHKYCKEKEKGNPSKIGFSKIVTTKTES